MQEAKKCAKCSYENPFGQIYCLNCGEFLSRKKTERKRVTVWGVEEKGDLDDDNRTLSESSSSLDEYAVICPQCSQMVVVQDGMIVPPFCDSCGFSLFGIDNIIKRKDVENQYDNEESDGNNENYESDITDKICVTANESRMRLIVRNRAGYKPEEINPIGDIIGSNGTVLKDININTEIKIFRAPTGWYAEILSGEAMIEGDRVNKQVERLLENGNMIAVDGYMIFVEITQ